MNSINFENTKKDDEITVTITNSLSNMKKVLKVKINETIYKIKIDNNFDINSKWKFNNKELDNFKTFNDYNIQEGDTINDYNSENKYGDEKKAKIYNFH